MADPPKFLYPRSRYRGQWSHWHQAFNAKQEFAQQDPYVCNLETNGKLFLTEAYQQIKQLWKQLKRNKKQLGIEQPESLE